MNHEKMVDLYGVTFDPVLHRALMTRYFREDGKDRHFTPDAMDLGVVPFYLEHRPGEKIRPHRHHFFELALVTGGTGTYIVEGERVDIGPGDLLLMNHNRVHAYEMGDRPVALINLCFEPALILRDIDWVPNRRQPNGRTPGRKAKEGTTAGDRIQVSPRTDLDYFRDFHLLRPFFWEDGQGVVFRPEERVFRRLSDLATDLIHAFHEKTPLDLPGKLRAGFLSLAHTLASAYGVARPLENHEGDFLGKVLRLAGETGETPGLGELATHFKMSPFAFSRRFKKRIGQTLPEFWSRRKIETAKNLLARSDMDVLRVALESGFESQAHFHRVFKELVGATPGAYRKNNR